MLREALLPSPGPTIFLQAIELRGQQPNTEIIFHYTDTRRPGKFAVRAAPWRERWSLQGAVRDEVDDAASVGGWIFSAWMADKLEPVDVSNPR
jgi:hypothetical protein